MEARTELFEPAVRSGLQVLEAMLEEDRTELCGLRYAHLSERRASRAGTVRSEVVLGGRKVAIRRACGPTARKYPCPRFRPWPMSIAFNRRLVEQMLVGVATRR